jgi:hypothetical protein
MAGDRITPDTETGGENTRLFIKNNGAMHLTPDGTTYSIQKYE